MFSQSQAVDLMPIRLSTRQLAEEFQQLLPRVVIDLRRTQVDLCPLASLEPAKDQTSHSLAEFAGMAGLALAADLRVTVSAWKVGEPDVVLSIVFESRRDELGLQVASYDTICEAAVLARMLELFPPKPVAAAVAPQAPAPQAIAPPEVTAPVVPAPVTAAAPPQVSVAPTNTLAPDEAASPSGRRGAVILLVLVLVVALLAAVIIWRLAKPAASVAPVMTPVPAPVPELPSAPAPQPAPVPIPVPGPPVPPPVVIPAPAPSVSIPAAAAKPVPTQEPAAPVATPAPSPVPVTPPKPTPRKIDGTYRAHEPYIPGTPDD